MSDRRDEVTLKEAAEYTVHVMAPELMTRREREIGEATAVLETMLSASRNGKTVKQRI